MKRAITLCAVTALGLAVLTACGGGGGEVSTGLGIVTSLESSVASTADEFGKVQVDSIIAAVTLDKDGKITKCSLDAAQTAVSFNDSGMITTSLNAPVLSKVEKKDDYGMRKATSINKEWFEQAAAFADWAVGKTPDQVKGLKTKVKDDHHQHVPDVPELASSVTIDAGEFIEAIEKAAHSAVKVTAKSGYKTGLGIYSSTASSKDASADADGKGQVDSYIAAVTVDTDGKIVACHLDVAQTSLPFNESGVFANGVPTNYQKSKLEKGDEYGMRKASGIGKEWYEQAEAFEKWAVGKTVAQVTGLKTKEDHGEAGIPDVPELASSVTISAEGFIKSIEKAVANAK